MQLSSKTVIGKLSTPAWCDEDQVWWSIVTSNELGISSWLINKRAIKEKFMAMKQQYQQMSNIYSSQIHTSSTWRQSSQEVLLIRKHSLTSFTPTMVWGQANLPHSSTTACPDTFLSFFYCINLSTITTVSFIQLGHIVLFIHF